MHRRQKIRTEILAALAGLSAVVRAGPIYPDTPLALPSVHVVMGEEEIADADDMLSRADLVAGQVRDLEIVLELRITADKSDGVDDELDALALEIERALGADSTLNGQCTLFRYTGSSESEPDDEIEVPVLLRGLTYQAQYDTRVDDPI